MTINKLKLNNTTLYARCWGHEHIKNNLRSLIVSCQQVDFSEVLLLAPLDQLEPFSKDINEFNIKTVNLNPMENLIEMNRFSVNTLNDFIDTDYCINVERDSSIIILHCGPMIFLTLII